MPTGDNSKKTEKGEEIDPRCIVDFRPVDDWNGEYGFDWFRRGDSIEFFNKKNTKSNYTTIVGKFIPKVDYDAIVYSGFQQNPFKRYAKYDKSIDEGVEDTQSDCLAQLCKEYPYRVIKGNSRNYFVPTLSLFYNNSSIEDEKWGPTKAIVKLLIDAENIRRLEFVYDDGITIETETVKYENTLLEIDSELPDGTQSICNNPKKYIDIESGKKQLYLEISSFLDSTNSEKLTKSIKVYAKTEEEIKNNKCIEGSYSGQLNIVFCKVKKIDICIIHVRIMDNHQPCSVPKPKEMEKEKERIKKSLAQAHILPNFIDETIDIEKNQIPDYFALTTDNSDQVMLVYPFSTVDSLYDVLLQEFNKLLINMDNSTKQKYEKSYKLFFINELGSLDDGSSTITGNLEGLANGDGDKREALVFKKNNPKTVPHELFHCLGLEHSFENSSKHTFKPRETSNLMDYSYGGLTLWQWQWDLLRKNQSDFLTESYIITNMS